MTLSSTFAAGPGASVGATNLGSVAQIVHRHGNEIEAPTQVKIQETKRYEGPTCRLDGPKTSQGIRVSSGEETSLAG